MKRFGPAAVRGENNTETRPSRRLSAFLLLATATLASAQREAASPHLALFETVVGTIESRFEPDLLRSAGADRATDASRRAAALSNETSDARKAVFAWLSHVPVSHLGILSRRGYSNLASELEGRRYPTLGFQVVHREQGYFVSDLMEHGVAARAGILANDRIVKVDGLPIADSPRLDQRTDDAWLEDPPRHFLLVDDGERVRIVIERTPGHLFRTTLTVTLDCGADADRRGIRVVSHEGRRIGYLPLSFMYDDAVTHVRRALVGPLSGVDALILDLRGRGGSAAAAAGLRRLFGGPGRTFRTPLVALIDNDTRSAKEVLAYDLRRDRAATLVGERTAGAVRPCTFLDVGDESVLMLPAGNGRHDPYTDAIELVGVDPDVAVSAAPPYSSGADPILDEGLSVAVELISRRRTL